MWNWDQGRLPYFQYDDLRTVSRFAVQNDLKNASAASIRSATGLPFPPIHYSPWRNYARVYKLTLIASEIDDVALPTDVARVLAADAVTTCDEYLHFLVQATTDPSPALSSWNIKSRIRYPLCFALKYILANVAVRRVHVCSYRQILAAYVKSNFVGDEDVDEFVPLVDEELKVNAILDAYRNSSQIRQARESMRFLSQISYLHSDRTSLIATIDEADARLIFDAMTPLTGPRLSDGDAEIQRIGRFFKDGSEHDFFDYPATTISETSDNGFAEGNRVRKTHIVVERNSMLRNMFFRSSPSAECQACSLDTHATYPWTDRVLDMHHVLPLASGTRVTTTGTLLDDLVAVCPTCHRSLHRYYDQWLSKRGKQDFASKNEARQVYQEALQAIVR